MVRKNVTFAPCQPGKSVIIENMERFAIEELKKWKENPSRKPLVLL